MKHTSVRPVDRVEQIVDAYGNMLFRLCLLTLGNASDAEDAVQVTLIRYFQKAPLFESPEHEKAWLIKVATNKCKDMLRFRKRHSYVNIDEVNEYTQDFTSYGIMDALFGIPEKFRMVLLLYYVEGYGIEEIAKIIGKTSSAVKMRLQKGRKLLSEEYRKEYL